MVDLPERNEEFEKAWDELQTRLNEPGFDVDAYLTEKRKELSEETIEQLYIATKIGKVYKLNKDFEQWVKKDEVSKGKRTGVKVTFKRVVYWALAAALSLIAIFLPTMTPGDLKPEIQMQQANLLPMFDLGKIIKTPFNIAREHKLHTGPNPISNFKSLYMSDNFVYSDIDKDGIIDFLFAQDGYVFCFDLDGEEKWAFELTLDNFEEDFLPKLDKTARYVYHSARPPYYKGKSKTHPFYKWQHLKENYTREQAFNLLKRDITLSTIMDFDNDNSQEVLFGLYGALFVLNNEGKLENISIDGKLCKHITVLDGSRTDFPKIIDDINNDGEPEMIIYRMSGYPMDADTGKSLYQEMPNGSEIYISKGEPYATRGLYVASKYGKELWHLNMPWHCLRVDVGDMENDGNKEIIIDTHTPQNSYFVRYDPAHREADKAGNNFDWSSLPANFPSIADDSTAALIIAGMKNNMGVIKYYQTASQKGSYHFFCPRFVHSKSGVSIEAIEYAGEFDYQNINIADAWHRAWIFDNSEFIPTDENPGYPDLYHFKTAGLFGFDTPKGPRRVFGLCPLSEIKLTDGKYSKKSNYVFNADDIKSHLRNKRTRSSWKNYATDAMVFDVKDIDNDGNMEILAGFGDFHSEKAKVAFSVIRILAYDAATDSLKPYHPDLLWDKYLVKGPVKDARFEKIDADEKYDVVVFSDYAYFLRFQTP